MGADDGSVGDNAPDPQHENGAAWTTVVWPAEPIVGCGTELPALRIYESR